MRNYTKEEILKVIKHEVKNSMLDNNPEVYDWYQSGEGKIKVRFLFGAKLWIASTEILETEIIEILSE